MLCSNFTWDCPYNAFGEEVFGHSQCISVLPYHLPLEKGWHFKRINIEFLPQKGAFVKFVWNRLENQNNSQIFKQQQWQTTDKYWSEKLNWVFDSDYLYKNNKTIVLKTLHHMYLLKCKTL